MAKSDNLRKAKIAKNDEFYTQLDDIVAEIAQHKDYEKHFHDKIVFCNCDDPEWSSFVEFFTKFFRKLKLKKIICTHYEKDGSPSYKLEWSGEKIHGNTVNMIKTPLKGNGDFRSEECVELLKEADIVVTNPPFSLFREYVAQLMEYDKEFVIIGNMNAIAYKEVFPLLRDNKVFIGYASGSKAFRVNDDYESSSTFIKDGVKYAKFGNICWFTNLDLDKSHEPLILTKNYYGNEQKYPKYENYDAIECGKVADIPKDYFLCWYDCPSASVCEYATTEGKPDSPTLCEQQRNGEIGVPITYMANHCNEQFEILGSDNDFAQDMKNIAQDGTYVKGGPAFYLSNNSQNVQVERERERERERGEQAFESLIGGSTTDLSFEGCHKCNGIIGVPITYLAEHCSEQFRIIGSGTGDKAKEIGITRNYRGRTDLEIKQDGKSRCPYNRILIQRKM